MKGYLVVEITNGYEKALKVFFNRVKASKYADEMLERASSLQRTDLLILYKVQDIEIVG